MLVELAVQDLGVIAELRLDFGPGMCALTGETGAGKTMIIEALALLLGAKPDPQRVRPGVEASIVEGRFLSGDDEVVLKRVVPADGRSRSYINGEMATAAAMAEAGSALVEICGQHAHQRLQSTRAQREALDRFGAIDLGPLLEAQRVRRELESRRAELGGDERGRAREIELLQFQLAELDRAAVTDPDEDDALSAEEDLLAGALDHLEAGSVALAALSDDGGVLDGLAGATSSVERHVPYAAVVGRLRDVLAELTDAVDELRTIAERIEPDPERLEVIRLRRHLLVELRRKYGDSLAEVMGFHAELSERLEDLLSHETRAVELDGAIATAAAEEVRCAAIVGAQRRRVAPELAAAVSDHLGELAMAAARVDIGVEANDPGDEVEFRMSTNSGMLPQPIARAASGGELSRTMLALHQVLSGGSSTMVFDEVDAGVGGGAATAVGRALAQLAGRTQVIVVTHLPQVAAFADVQLSVSKSAEGLAVSTIRRLDDAERVIELSRMLSGSPDSETARRHAEELLVAAAAERGR